MQMNDRKNQPTLNIQNGNNEGSNVVVCQRRDKCNKDTGGQQHRTDGRNSDFIFAMNRLGNDRSVTDQIFAFAMGFMAFADFCAAMAKRHHRHKMEVLPTNQASILESVIDWLCTHSTTLGITFSLLWFIDAFLAAHRKCMEVARQHDKQSILDNDKTYDDMKEWWKGYQGVYVRSVMLQILLLPVGFFISLYESVLWLFDPIMARVVGGGTTVHHTFGGILDKSEVFSSTSSISLGFAVVKHTLTILAQRTNSIVQLQAMDKKRKLIYKLALRGLRHPFRFNQRLRFFFSVVRWIQYLGPLFGTANKLKGNVDNLLSKIKQRRLAAVAAKVRQQHCSSLRGNQLRFHYATLIQKTYRAYATRRRLYFLKALKGEKELIAAIKMQGAFRGALMRARATLNAKLQTLQALKEKEIDSLKNSNPAQMSTSERRRMYLLQEELESKAKSLINQKLLLRPDTTFAVMWKIMFVVAVIFEISTLACQPLIARHKDPVTGKQLDMEAIMDKKFIPVLVLQRAECTGKLPLKLSFAHPIRSFKQLKDAFVKRWQPEKPRPWYCEGPYVRFQAIYISVADFVLHRFLVLISIVMFVDVYVEFFTGKYDKNSGHLVPPPFFERYIFPGLLLQLMVNPEMDTVAYILSKTAVGLVHHDPVRILRWIVALFYPLFLLLKNLLQELWVVYVKDQNQNSLQYVYKFIVF
jgi:hypothetical protein